MDDEGTLEVIQRIAESLGVNEDAFFSTDINRSSCSASQKLSESLEIFKAFGEISDPEVRRNCLELVKTFASISIKAIG